MSMKVPYIRDPKYFNLPDSALGICQEVRLSREKNLITGASTVQATISREKARRHVTQVTVCKLTQINCSLSRIQEEYLGAEETFFNHPALRKLWLKPRLFGLLLKWELIPGKKSNISIIKSIAL